LPIAVEIVSLSRISVSTDGIGSSPRTKLVPSTTDSGRSTVSEVV
jgi:hypothetical protein